MRRSTLPPRLRRAIELSDDLESELSYRESLLTLFDVHALHLAPLDQLGGAEEWQHDPGVAAVKGRLEAAYRTRLGADVAPTADAVGALRRIARQDLVPPVYEWLAHRASAAEVAEFLALEGGPDADFDDLVALCQIGLDGLPKLTFAANYWDEMGRGDPAAVHTELHRQMVQALELPEIPVEDLPVEALDRKVLGGFLATNRALQPEMIGALGLLECQAGPRCRRVVAALRRIGAETAALPFYEEHATADPRHGRAWVDHGVVPLLERRPDWGPRIVRGARWRATVNHRFFTAMAERFGCTSRHAA
jgi:hypothetical protein